MDGDFPASSDLAYRQDTICSGVSSKMAVQLHKLQTGAVQNVP